MQNAAVGFVLDNLGDAEFWNRKRGWLLALRRNKLDPSGVEGLAAAGGIKCGALQHQRAPSVGEFPNRLDGGYEVELK